MVLDNKEVSIRTADKDDSKIAHGIIHTCFSTDPAFSWLADDPAELNKLIDDFLVVYVKLGLEKGVIQLAETSDMGVIGVTIWRPHDAEDVEAEEELVRLAGKNAPRLMMQVEAVTRSYPPVAPYEVLMASAVHPKAQGCGIGSILIANRLNELDKIGMPTYLEATTRRSAGGIYRRFGYQPVGEAMCFPGGIEVYPMWRNAQKPAPITRSIGPDIGSIMRFGNYDWRVLDVQDNKALLLCDKVLEKRMYHSEFADVNWAKSDLRRYLNTEFSAKFEAAEQARIVETSILNYNNPWFGTSGGELTKDKIFLLSIDEVIRFFGDSKQLYSKNPNTKYYIDDHFNSARKALDSEGQASWWLRSPGNVAGFAAAITANGRISVSGDFVTRSNNEGIRPALWLSL